MKGAGDPGGGGEELAALLERIVRLPRRGRRCLVAIAGPPASGKSTLAAALTARLAETGAEAANVPMDGFHLDNRILDARGLRARKGAPETFDAAGFLSLVRRLREEEAEVYYPIFDRAQDQAIAGAGVVGGNGPWVVVEGNYLLFAAPPWNALADLWDLSVWIETPEEVVRARCIQRWLDHGHAPEEARERAEHNDLRNARRIREARLPADLTLRGGRLQEDGPGDFF